MMAPGGISGLQQTTSYKVVIPFYAYAALSLLVACIFLLFNSDLFDQHHFNPKALVLTHIMALGWGSMVIFGASHQLLPVLIEGKLSSNLLAYLTFIFTAIGIPILVVGFYQFNFDWLIKTGGILINIGVLFYLINVIKSVYDSDKHEVHAWFVLTASVWLFSTTFFGLLLLFNFGERILPENSLEYLSVHAHLGLVGWFLLMVMGVGSRLIPMFLISKYTNNRNLWLIYGLVHLGLLSFIGIKIGQFPNEYLYFPIISLLAAIFLFSQHAYKAYRVRIRKKIDDQMKVSLISVAQMLIPLVVLLGLLFWMPGQNLNLNLLYGFVVFFGWITAIIFGMTFKTLPFIVWNRVYQKKAHQGKTPAPKELFKESFYTYMSIAYLIGFLLMLPGIIWSIDKLIQIAAVFLLAAAVFYVFNTAITLFHKPKKL